MSAVTRLRALFDDVVWRSLVLMAAASLVVALAFLTGLAERAEGHGTHDDAAGGHGAHAVTSEAAFLAAMIPHHQEAVDSAAELLAITEREEVRDLAEAIVTVQADEIAQMRAWLAAWYPDRPAEVPYDPMMRPFVGLRPAEADQVFVADMIHHHEAALAMAGSYVALRGPKRPELVSLAEDMLRTQRAEIALLQLMLQMWGVVPPDHDAH